MVRRLIYYPLIKTQGHRQLAPYAPYKTFVFPRG